MKVGIYEEYEEKEPWIEDYIKNGKNLEAQNTH